jgi:hypothetical protein
MNRYEFDLNILPLEYLDYYRGAFGQVVVRCTTGKMVQFPAALLRRFITPTGIQGHFVLTCNERNQHAELHREDAASQSTAPSA